ncbi:protein tweety homolog 3-like isoform X2 [Oscarella lobularis]|uniref:protein tweety homolog 3-like isoform X2 n=1 Tax=Oscarella lobularis TaxID=121494 RepID=UPI00331343FF
MSSSCVSPYSPPPLVDSLHDLPRVDLHFHEASSEFQLDSQSYREGLAVWAIIAGSFSILLLLIALLYLVYKCCFPPQRAREPKTGNEWFCLAFVAAFAVVAVVIAIGGGAKAFVDTDTAIDGFIEINARLDAAREKISSINNDVKRIDSDMKSLLNNKFDPAVEKLVAGTFDKIFDVRKQVDNIQSLVDCIHLDEYVKIARQYRRYGEYGMLPVFCYLGLLAVVSLMICWRRVICLKFLAALALVGLLLCGLMSGVTMGLSLAGSDVCMNPDGYFLNYTSNSDDREVLEYYVYCDDCPFPYIEEFNKAFSDVSKIKGAFQVINRLLSEKKQERLRQVLSDTSEIEESLVSLRNVVICNDIHQSYLKSRDAVCKETIIDLVLLLLATLIASIPIMIIVMCEQHAWWKLREIKRYRKREYDERSPLASSETRSMNLQLESSTKFSPKASPIPSAPVDPPPLYTEIESDF